MIRYGLVKPYNSKNITSSDQALSLRPISRNLLRGVSANEGTFEGGFERGGLGSGSGSGMTVLDPNILNPRPVPDGTLPPQPVNPVVGGINTTQLVQLVVEANEYLRVAKYQFDGRDTNYPSNLTMYGNRLVQVADSFQARYPNQPGVVYLNQAAREAFTTAEWWNDHAQAQTKIDYSLSIFDTYLVYFQPVNGNTWTNVLYNNSRLKMPFASNSTPGTRGWYVDEITRLLKELNDMFETNRENPPEDDLISKLRKMKEYYDKFQDYLQKINEFKDYWLRKDGNAGDDVSGADPGKVPEEEVGLLDEDGNPNDLTEADDVADPSERYDPDPQTEDGGTQTDQPAAEDGGTQTDQPAAEDGGTQTDQPTGEDGGTQTDQTATEDGGTQTDQPAGEDGGTQTDQTPTQDQGTQTDQPPTQDGGTQTTDSGTQPPGADSTGGQPTGSGSGTSEAVDIFSTAAKAASDAASKAANDAAAKAAAAAAAAAAASAGFGAGYAAGVGEGTEKGYKKGYEEGYKGGYVEGYRLGKREQESAVQKAYNEGYALGQFSKSSGAATEDVSGASYDEIYQLGYNRGKADTESSAYAQGFSDGSSSSMQLESGYTRGYNDGLADAKATNSEAIYQEGFNDGVASVTNTTPSVDNPIVTGGITEKVVDVTSLQNNLQVALKELSSGVTRFKAGDDTFNQYLYLYGLQFNQIATYFENNYPGLKDVVYLNWSAKNAFADLKWWNVYDYPTLQSRIDYSLQLFEGYLKYFTNSNGGPWIDQFMNVSRIGGVFGYQKIPSFSTTPETPMTVPGAPPQVTDAEEPEIVQPTVDSSPVANNVANLMVYLDQGAELYRNGDRNFHSYYHKYGLELVNIDQYFQTTYPTLPESGEYTIVYLDPPSIDAFKSLDYWFDYAGLQQKLNWSLALLYGYLQFFPNADNLKTQVYDKTRLVKNTTVKSHLDSIMTHLNNYFNYYYTSIHFRLPAEEAKQVGSNYVQLHRIISDNYTNKLQRLSDDEWNFYRDFETYFNPGDGWFNAGNWKEAFPHLQTILTSLQDVLSQFEPEMFAMYGPKINDYQQRLV